MRRRSSAHCEHHWPGSTSLTVFSFLGGRVRSQDHPCIAWRNMRSRNAPMKFLGSVQLQYLPGLEGCRFGRRCKPCSLFSPASLELGRGRRVLRVRMRKHDRVSLGGVGRCCDAGGAGRPGQVILQPVPMIFRTLSTLSARSHADSGSRETDALMLTITYDAPSSGPARVSADVRRTLPFVSVFAPVEAAPRR